MLHPRDPGSWEHGTEKNKKTWAFSEKVMKDIPIIIFWEHDDLMPKSGLDLFIRWCFFYGFYRTHGKITIQSPPSTALVGDHESWISNSVTRIRNVFGWCVFLKGGNYRFYRSDFGETGTCAIHPNRGYVFNNIGFCVKILKMSRWFPVFFGMNPRLPTPSSEGVLGYEVFGLQIPPITRCLRSPGEVTGFWRSLVEPGKHVFCFFFPVIHKYPAGN